MIFVLIFLFLCVWLVHVYFEIEKKRVHLPGPKGIPIFGNFFQMEKKIHEHIYKVTDKYGPLAYKSMFNMHEVLIGDVKLAKELFSRDDTTGKPRFDMFVLFEGEFWGVVSSQGELWEVHRRFTLRHLRDFGFGKNAMETLIMDECSEFMARLTKTNGMPIGAIKDKLSLPVVNSLWKIVSGKRFNQEDAKLTKLVKHIHDITTAPMESGAIMFLVPWVRHIIPDYSGYNKLRKAFGMLREFVQEELEQHRKTFQLDSPRDFIDVYLNELENAKNDPNSTFHGEKGVKQMTATIGDLFLAGADTTSMTLAWAFLYFVRYPQVQEKIQAEITSITGDSRQVSVADRTNMPYLQATIDEVLRMSTITPFGAQHIVLRDMTINGVHYPKGTTLSINIYFIHHSPKNWGDPENFRPERFLSEDGKVFKKSENVVAFSLGKRQCLGELLARDTIFLFIANILQQFNVKEDPNNPQPSMEPSPSFVLNPQEYSVVFEERIVPN